jgi:hydrogenase nickel incorporation protein HypA/HybF
MHELSIVDALIEQVQVELDDAGQKGRVLRLELSIGRLSGVHGDSIRFAFELLSPGTRVENAEIVICEPRAVCNCRNCNSRVEIDEIVIQCPKCASDDITIEGGQELVLNSIDVED